MPPFCASPRALVQLVGLTSVGLLVGLVAVLLTRGAGSEFPQRMLLWYGAFQLAFALFGMVLLRWFASVGTGGTVVPAERVVLAGHMSGALLGLAINPATRPALFLFGLAIHVALGLTGEIMAYRAVKMMPRRS